MTAEEIRRMEERVAQVRAEMERACRAAGRAPGEVLLCAASKTQNSETVRAAAALDIDLFGENRVQELTEKLAAWLLACKGLSAADVRAESHAAYKERQYDLLADAVRTAVDIAAVYRAMDACAAK